MFAGESEHTLDDKNRLVIPRRILDALEAEEDRERFFLTRGISGCLFLYTRGRFERISRELTGTSFFERRDARDFKRLFFSDSQEVALDAQNRILIPEPLKALSRIEREVVVVGVADRVEIWSAPVWQGLKARMQARYDELADLLEGDGTAAGGAGA